MAYIHQEEIIGYRVNDQVIYCDCVSEDERKGKFTAKGIITKEDIAEGDFCFCDRCGDDVRDSAAWSEKLRAGTLNRDCNEGREPAADLGEGELPG